MSNIAIKVEDVSKLYQLGKISTGTISRDLNRWWAKVNGKEDPYSILAKSNNRSEKANSDFVWSLKDINFEIRKGDAVGIIGRNGAGKSTLLKILSRVTSPTTGSIKINGRIASLLEVGTGFNPELTGRENIYMNGAILGMSRAEITGKLSEIVDFSGCEAYIDTPVKRYSSGMYVRLAFAVAAYLEPEILIVDEVLAVGDAEFQKKCLGKMQDVNSKDGRTVLFVSHNMPSIKNLCKNAILMSNGELAFSGNVQDTIDKYLAKYDDEVVKSPLNVRIDRKGSQLLSIHSVSLIDEKNEVVTGVQSGSKARLKITLNRKDTKLVFNDIAIRIVVYDTVGDVKFVCNNKHSSLLFELDDITSNQFVVHCIIPRIPLFGGVYRIDIRCNSQFNGLLDEVENAYSLVIEDGDFFHTGKIPEVKSGLLVEHTWERE